MPVTPPAAHLLLRRRRQAAARGGVSPAPAALLLRRRRPPPTPPSLPPDLLSALIAYLRSEPTVAAVLSAGFGQGGYGAGGFGGRVQVYDETAPADAWPPFLEVHGYAETEEGESLEDEHVTADLLVVTASLDQARDVGTIIKAAVDTPNESPDSLGRPPFVFEGGAETWLKRTASRPQRLPGIGKGGTYVYAEQVSYEFWVSPA